MALWGKTDSDDSMPKYLTDEQRAQAFFVDSTEAATDESKKKGITGSGWWRYSTYKTSDGVTRHKAEHLIPMRQDSVFSGDRINDAKIELPTTYVISIATKPANVTVTAPAVAAFSVVAGISTGGGVLSYQWQKSTAPNGSVFVDVVNGGVYSNATTNSLSISNSTGLNNIKYRVVVSAANAVSMTSAAVKLAVE